MKEVNERQIAAEMGEYSKDLIWLSENIDSLQREYSNQYVLVKHGEIKAASHDYDELLEKARDNGIDVATAVIERIVPVGTTILL